MSTSSSPGGRGRHTKGRISTSTMANGETSRTTTSKLNKNQHNNSTDTTTAISPSSNVNIRGNGEHKTTSGGGRTRRRSAPPTNLEGMYQPLIKVNFEHLRLNTYMQGRHLGGGSSATKM